MLQLFFRKKSEKYEENKYFVTDKKYCYKFKGKIINNKKMENNSDNAEKLKLDISGDEIKNLEENHIPDKIKKDYKYLLINLSTKECDFAKSPRNISEILKIKYDIKISHMSFYRYFETNNHVIKENVLIKKLIWL